MKLIAFFILPVALNAQTLTQRLPTYWEAKTEVFYEDFNTSPSEWVQSGAWSVSNGILSTPANGGIDTTYHFDTDYFLDRYFLRAKIKCTNAGRLALVKQKYETGIGRGTIAEVDFSNNKLVLYKAFAATLPDTLRTKSVTTTTDNWYYLTLYRDRNVTKLELFDIENRTVQDVEVSVAENATSSGEIYPGDHWGVPGVVFFSGAFQIDDIQMVAIAPPSPAIVIIGDSFTDGYTLNETIGARHNKYADRILAWYKGNAVVSGRGGATSTTLISDHIDGALTPFSPLSVLVWIGANDTDSTTWKNNITTLADTITASGATAYFGTLLPRADRQSFLTAGNNWLIGSGFNYIDFSQRITTGGDRLTQDSAYFGTSGGFTSDGVHPNIAGHYQCFLEFISK